LTYFQLKWLDYDGLTAADTPRTDADEQVAIWADVMPWDVDHATAVITYRPPRSVLPDHIALGGMDMLLSLRAKLVIEDTQLGDEIGFLPTKILTRQKKHLADYFYLYSRESKDDALDLVQSDITYFAETGFIDTIDRWVFNPSCIPATDLFFSHYKWIASENLKSRFEAHGLSGFQFISI
jgi:hypothetical protein